MILVSACLMGKNCKYNGGNNFSQPVLQWLKGKDYLLICPEAEGGLPIPRIPAERQGDRVVDSSGKDVTEYFQRGAAIALERARESGAEIAVLKARSPSCGVHGIYDGSFQGVLVPGMGVTAELLHREGIRLITEDEIEIMLNRQER